MVQLNLLIRSTDLTGQPKRLAMRVDHLAQNTLWFRQGLLMLLLTGCAYQEPAQVAMTIPGLAPRLDLDCVQAVEPDYGLVGAMGVCQY